MSDPHRRKQDSPNTSTDAGRMISINPLTFNAYCSIRDNIDLDSNLTDVSDRHQAKQPSPKISTDPGRIISINPVRLNVLA
jgi:hypothetical protein